MILSSDELEILEYLKSFGGKYVTMVEICRSAGGRRKFRESPNWAKPLMSHLVDSGNISVNERGHYCWIDLANPPKPGLPFPLPTRLPAQSKTAVIVGDDYFPATESNEVEQARWMSPQIAEILKRSGKKFNGSK